MGAVKENGAEWMISKVAGKKKAPPSFEPPEGVTPAQIDEAEKLFDRPADDGKKLVAGVKHIDAALQRFVEAGITPDLLILLVKEKAPYPRGAKNPLNAAQVEACLKGLFAIGEWIR